MRAALAVLVLVLVTACGGGGRQAVSTGGQQLIKKYASAPRSADEYHNIFGKQTENPREIEDVLRRTESSGFTIPLATRTKTAAQKVLDDFAQQESGYMILIGHNDKGMFRFPDTSSFDLRSVSNPKATLVVISCESYLYASRTSIGVPSELIYEVAYSTQAKFVARINAATPPVSRSAAQTMLDESFRAAVVERGAKKVAGATLGVGVTASVIGISIRGDR
ncbi:hypothetical protein AB0M48_28030 [Lentzea sp. NPDC051208]|uniref:hypothetical protein n=1 Tax=Lentzea sp. NPDC051208 TaxID=3154642 RepID=UPI003426C032